MTHERRSGCHQHTVLVDAVQFVETPQCKIPAPVWFDRVDGVYSRLPHSLYFSRAFGLVFRGVFADRKTGRSIWRATCGQNKLQGEMIKSASEIVDGVTGDCNCLGRNIPNAPDIVNALSRCQIIPSQDFIWAGIEEGPDLRIEITDVLFGPF